MAFSGSKMKVGARLAFTFGILLSCLPAESEGMLCYLCESEKLVHHSYERVELTNVVDEPSGGNFNVNFTQVPEHLRPPLPPTTTPVAPAGGGGGGAVPPPNPPGDGDAAAAGRRRRRRQIKPRQGAAVTQPFLLGTTWVKVEPTASSPRPPASPSFRWGPLPCPENNKVEDDMIVECSAGVDACFKLDGFEVRRDNPNQNGSVWKIIRRGCFTAPESESEEDLTDRDRQQVLQQEAARTADGTTLLGQSKNNKCIDGKQDGTDIFANRTTVFEAKVCVCDGTRPHAQPDVAGGEEPYTERNPKMPCNQAIRNGIGVASWLWLLIVPMVLMLQIQGRV